MRQTGKVTSGSVTSGNTSGSLPQFQANHTHTILRLTEKTMSNSKHLQSGIMSTKQMEVSANIDWISATYPDIKFRDNNSAVLPDDYHNGFSLVKPVNGYQTAVRYNSGAMEMWHTNYPDMGIHVIYSGQAIRNACETFNCEQYEILDYLMLGAKIVRLDMALDVENVDIDIQNIHTEFKKGNVKTRAKTSDYMERATSGNEKGAATCYIGSTHKRKKLLRVYDKGEQLGLDTLLTRFELETHGTIANNAAKELMVKPDILGSKISGMVKGYADLSKQVPDGIFNSDSIKIALPKYQKSDTAKWLVDVVAKTLANEAFSDYTVMERFLEKFRYEYDNLINEKGYHEYNND